MNVWVMMFVLVTLTFQDWFHICRIVILPAVSCWSSWTPAGVSYWGRILGEQAVPALLINVSTRPNFDFISWNARWIESSSSMSI